MSDQDYADMIARSQQNIDYWLELRATLYRKMMALELFPEATDAIIKVIDAEVDMRKTFIAGLEELQAKETRQK